MAYSTSPLGAVLAIVALWLRASWTKPSKQDAGAEEAGLRVVAQSPGLAMVLRLPPPDRWLHTTYMQKYLVNTAGMTASTASVIMTAALFVLCWTSRYSAPFSDKVGRRTSMLCFGVLATLYIVPILQRLAKVSFPYAAFGLVMICAFMIVGFYTDQRRLKSR